jgi:hypothetical protein
LDPLAVVEVLQAKETSLYIIIVNEKKPRKPNKKQIGGWRALGVKTCLIA